MHGLGIHPDWPQVVNPLRVALAEQGWSTLSIQLPILANEAEGEDYQPLMKEVPARMAASLKHLKAAGYQKFVLVAHSLGASMASYYLANTEHEISGMVGIGMNVGNVERLSSIHIPLLDLYGEKDLEGVLASAADRQHASANNAGYQQIITPEADHFYDGFETPLIDTVAHWLEQL